MGKTFEYPLAPSSEDITLAQESSRCLTAVAGHQVTCTIKAADGKPIKIKLPASVVEMLTQMLTQMAQGKAVGLIPINAQLTTQQAADILGVSRPFVTAQMKIGKLRFHKIGTHRRIAFSDLMKYRSELAKESEDAMDALVAEAQELNLGYD